MMLSLPKLNPYPMNLKKVTAVISCGYTSSIAMRKPAVVEEGKQRSLGPVFPSTLSSSFLKFEQAGELLLGMMGSLRCEVSGEAGTLVLLSQGSGCGL